MPPCQTLSNHGNHLAGVDCDIAMRRLIYAALGAGRFVPNAVLLSSWPLDLNCKGLPHSRMR